ncbi:hypothetical protein L1049_018078 [Liquidambar formosana]|uniref:Uncharacterized protein n=1 Tax=Liquidambar formosana TaxID=63359 RepID=A0AAP0R9N4_LIQFO
MSKGSDTPSIKKLFLSTSSAAINDQSRRNQSIAMKSHEPETVRRRRDSLDRSWASFEPPKTTVKRMLLQERQKVSTNKSLFWMDKQHFSPHILEGSAVTHSKDRTTLSSFVYTSGIKGIQDSTAKQASESPPASLFKWANDLPGPSHSVGSKYPTLQTNNLSAFSSSSAPQSSSIVVQNSARETGGLTAERPSDGVSHTEKSDSVSMNVIKSTLQSENLLHQAPSVSKRSPAQTLSWPKKSTEKSNSNSKEVLLTKSTIGIAKHRPMTESLFFETGESHDPPFSHVPAVPSVPGKVFQFDTVANENKPGDKVLSSPTFSVSLSATSSFPMINSSSALQSSLPNLSSTAPTLSATSSFPMINSSSALQSSLPNLSSTAPTSSSSMSFGRIFTVSKATVDASQTVSSISPSSASSSPIPSSSSSFQAPETIVPSSIPLASMNSTSDFPQTELQPSLGKFNSKTNVNSTTLATTVRPDLPTSEFSLKLEPSASSAPTIEQPVLPTSELSLKLEPSASSAPTIEVSTGLASGSELRLNNITSTGSSVALNGQPEQPSAAHVLFASPFSISATATGGKNESSDNSVTQEDEMEEEAPETSHTAELTLGTLGGFGLGSASNPTASKPNPFGGPFANIVANTASSQYNMTVPSGELFRPASFSFQSPQPSQQSQPANLNAFAGGLSPGTTAQAPSGSGFGQPAQIGSGQQALGSVLGAFGQSRQLGAGLPGTGFASSSGFGGGFANTHSTGGFLTAANGGGFAALASGAGGFAGAASAAGGFGGAASGGGFPAAGGGFGAFSNQQASGGFSAFGSNAGGTAKPQSELFTQIRK